jgi:hypothetical protein
MEAFLGNGSPGASRPSVGECAEHRYSASRRRRGIIAAARDVEKSPNSGARGGATDAGSVDNLHEESPATPWEREASNDSRGGTRTRDPGIMSAVL